MRKFIYTCNKCGKNLDEWDIKGGFASYRALGYGSKHDGMKVELDLCCDCMDNLIDSCVVSPLIKVCVCERDLEF